MVHFYKRLFLIIHVFFINPNIKGLESDLLFLTILYTWFCICGRVFFYFDFIKGYTFLIKVYIAIDFMIREVVSQS